MEWTVVYQKAMDQTEEKTEEDLNRMADKKQGGIRLNMGRITRRCVTPSRVNYPYRRLTYV